MSKYTTQLRWIIENAEANGIDKYKAVGLDSYPIFDEIHRKTLSDKIINHYYFREIGVETVELFRFMMQRQMNEIMPYYNQLYKSELLITDPLNSRDLWITEDNKRAFVEDFNRGFNEDSNKSLDDKASKNIDETIGKTTKDDYTKDGKEDYTKDNINHTISSNDGTSHTTATDSNSNVYSNTPMNLLADGMTNNAVRNLQYATEVTFDDNNSVTDGKTTDKSQSDVTANEDLDKTTKETFDRDMTENTTRNFDESDTRNATEKYGHSSNEDTLKNFDETTNKVRHEAGYTEAQADILMRYRKTLLNIDMMVIDELNDLFMGVW